jgi:hypothetical protein
MVEEPRPVGQRWGARAWHNTSHGLTERTSKLTGAIGPELMAGCHVARASISPTWHPAIH